MLERESLWKICKSKLNYLQRYQLHSTFIPMLICFADLLKNGYISPSLLRSFYPSLCFSTRHQLPLLNPNTILLMKGSRENDGYVDKIVRARFLSQLMHKFIQIKMLYLIYFCLAVCRCIFYFVCWLVVIRLC